MICGRPFSGFMRALYGWVPPPITNFNFLDSDDEINRELGFVGAGILAMANAGPNTNGEDAASISPLSSLMRAGALDWAMQIVFSKVKFEK